MHSLARKFKGRAFAVNYRYIKLPQLMHVVLLTVMIGKLLNILSLVRFRTCWQDVSPCYGKVTLY
jgi:hypothetical protein